MLGVLPGRVHAQNHEFTKTDHPSFIRNERFAAFLEITLSFRRYLEINRILGGFFRFVRRFILAFVFHRMGTHRLFLPVFASS